MAAIYDNSGTTDAGNTSLSNVSATISSGAALWVFVSADSGAAPTSVMWNTSEALTLINTDTNFLNDTLWYIANPTSGTHNITTSFGASHFHFVSWVSTTGQAVSPLGANNHTGAGNTGPYTLSLTTTGANSLVVSFVSINGPSGGSAAGVITVSGTNQTMRSQAHVATDNWNGGASTQTTTTAGSYAQTYAMTVVTPQNGWNVSSVEVLSAAAPTVNSGFFFAVDR